MILRLSLLDFAFLSPFLFPLCVSTWGNCANREYTNDPTKLAVANSCVPFSNQCADHTDRQHFLLVILSHFLLLCPLQPFHLLLSYSNHHHPSSTEFWSCLDFEQLFRAYDPKLQKSGQIRLPFCFGLSAAIPHLPSHLFWLHQKFFRRVLGRKSSTFQSAFDLKSFCWVAWLALASILFSSVHTVFWDNSASQVCSIKSLLLFESYVNF